MLDFIRIYREFYSLSTLTYKEEVNFDFFKVCRKNHRFIVVAIHNHNGEILLIRDFNKNIGWELIGGYVRRDERVEEEINRVVLKETGLLIDELRPIALINNNFECENQTISHWGIAFSALVRGRVKRQPDHIQAIYTKMLPEKIAYQNREIAERAFQVFQNRVHKIPLQEIESAKKFFLPHCFNKYIVKRLIGRFASRKINNVILRLILHKPKSIIDVACGDDDLLLRLEELYRPEICIGNDISWQIISLLLRKTKRNSNVLFTNHNVLELPFKNKFELLIFKNTLHHISPHQRIDLIKKLSELAKQLIIVDIEDPLRSNFLAKIWHWYYIHFLGDCGTSFLTLQQLREIMDRNLPDRKISYGLIKTIKGSYFYASYTDVIKGERKEVEVKVKIDESQVALLRKKLLTLGALEKDRSKEVDVYFNSPLRDFIKSRECLRIRQKNGGYLELTYKGPTTEIMKKEKQFWKSELDIPIYNCSVQDLKTFLNILGFEEIVEVVKERQRFVLEKQTITFDKLKDVGWFLEVESTAQNAKEEKEAISGNINLLRQLGLSRINITEEPYRDIVLKARRADLCNKAL